MASRSAREPVGCGNFYPADKVELRETVRRLLEATECRLEPDRQLKAVATPHAAFAVSGAVAAEAFACFQNRKIETVVLVGPDHYIGFEGIAVYSQGAFRTPLGEVEVDEDLAGWMVETGDGVQTAPEAHVREHCLEVQLPFLQTVVPGARIVPVLMGFRSKHNVETLASILSQALERRGVCLLATTDLSHYHPRRQARELDVRLGNLVRAFAPAILWEDLQEGRVEACGGDSLVSVMLGAGIAGAELSRVLKYQDSGEANGNVDHVIGYLSAAFFRGSPSQAVDFETHARAVVPRSAESVVGSAT